MLVVGLGNPGATYEGTRHNAGFEALDLIAAEYGFEEWRYSKKHEAAVAGGQIRGKNCTLAKPQTFMNDSGRAVKSLASQLSSLSSLLVIHDDVDLPLGEVGAVQNRGSAGHKGVESVIRSLGTKDFRRIRVGIRPETGKPQDTERFVLQKFSSKEKEFLDEALAQVLALL